MTIKARLLQMIGLQPKDVTRGKQLSLLIDSIEDVPAELEELRDRQPLATGDVKRILEALEQTVSDCIEVLTEKDASPELRAEIRKFRNRLRQGQR
jgi:hypothetical protein